MDVYELQSVSLAFKYLGLLSILALGSRLWVRVQVIADQLSHSACMSTSGERAIIRVNSFVSLTAELN